MPFDIFQYSVFNFDIVYKIFRIFFFVYVCAPLAV